MALGSHEWKTHRHIHIYSCTNIPHLIFFPPVYLNGKGAWFPDAVNLRKSLGLWASVCWPSIWFSLWIFFAKCFHLIAETKSPFRGSRNLSLLPSSSPISSYPQPDQGPSWSSQKHLEANSSLGGCSQVGYPNKHMASHPAVTMISIKRNKKLSVVKINIFKASQVALVVKNLPASAGHARDLGSITGSGRSPGEGNGYPLQYSCLEDSMDRGAWLATVHGVMKSQTHLSTCTWTGRRWNFEGGWRKIGIITMIRRPL